jgi:molecular chaperone HtpG
MTIAENTSIREWNKHLAISNWLIRDNGEIVFRARCQQAIVHHTIVRFCDVISEEIRQTRSIYDDENDWPLQLLPRVIPEIESEGYRYLPYNFSLDEERIYQLLMGRAIYSDEMDAVRELIQNSVDACHLRDALMRRYQPSEVPSNSRRIVVRLEPPAKGVLVPRISVTDSGVGMDRWIIEKYLLKVGRSYYQSSDFLRIRAELRKGGFDFAPISEFGIGIMSCFMLGNRLEIDTAAWRPARGDSRRRLLRIDGISRLIEVADDLSP